ncbi:MAG: ATP-binding protein [Deltaproteobacteria bacterium]|nr:ATP-binding protein [Deltaproteobacteria bacterium]
MFHRLITPLESTSFFIFGARGTGKTSFLREFFKGKNVYWLDFLEPELEFSYSQNPSQLKQELDLRTGVEWVVLDEIQKVPSLLNVVHQLIESTSLRFALTGSSARKLKKKGTNLLAGRAFLNTLYPLTSPELADLFSLSQVLQWGSLPKIYSLTSDIEKRAYLKTYTYTYLKEEIVSEQVIRKLEPFHRFLEIAAQSSGEILNFTNIARDVGADPKTIQSYYQILEDTLIGFLLPAYHHSIRKQQRQASKFYLFDLGVKRALENNLHSAVTPSTYGFGKLFEHFLITEIVHLNEYYRRDFRFYYLRTQNQLEVDLIIERPGMPRALVEIKSSDQVDERDTKTLSLFLQDIKPSQGFCLSLDPRAKKIGNVHCLHWQEGLKEIGLID